MSRVALPTDGATYRCCFETFIDGEDWRCSKDAVAGFDLDTIEVFEQHNIITLAGRAFCELHCHTIEIYTGVST